MAPYVHAARRLLSVASLVILPVAWWLIVSNPNNGGDAMAYWSAWKREPMYDDGLGGAHAYLYPPVFAQLSYPLTLLPFAAFYGVLTALSMRALVYLVGLPWAGLTLVLFYPAWHDLAVGNIHLLIGASIVAGVWAFPLLTKVTPVVGLLALPWREAGKAVGITAGIAAVSFLVAPELWFGWFDLAIHGAEPHPWTYLNFWPLWFRVLLGAGIAVVARRWFWLMPVAVLVALPAVWLGSLAILLAIPRAYTNRWTIAADAE